VTAPATGVVMHPEYAKVVGRLAYVWGWPMVNMLNRSAAITTAPQPGLLNGVLPVAPRGQVGMLADYIDAGQTFVTCPNQDVVYGLGFFSLDEEPVVVQVPDFGDRFWVYALYDARTDQFAELGKPYKTALLARHQEQEPPEGRRRLADAVHRCEVAGRRQGVELAAGTGRPLLALHPRLLGPAGHSRRLVEAARHSEGQVGARRRVETSHATWVAAHW
jgi:hypothetical protein